MNNTVFNQEIISQIDTENHDDFRIVESFAPEVTRKGTLLKFIAKQLSTGKHFQFSRYMNPNTCEKTPYSFEEVQLKEVTETKLKWVAV